MTATLNSTGVLFPNNTQINTATVYMRMRTFNSGTTYVVPSDVNSFLVMVSGATGGGSTNASGGIGGAGYSEKYYSGTLSASYSFSIGAGGTGSGTSGGNTTFDTITVTSSAGLSAVSSAGGAGGVASGGSFNANGGNGGTGVSTSSGGGGGGGGAGSRAGAGGTGGNASTNMGGGGGGTGGNNGSGATAGIAATTISGTVALSRASLISLLQPGATPSNYSEQFQAGVSGAPYPGGGGYGGDGAAGVAQDAYGAYTSSYGFGGKAAFVNNAGCGAYGINARVGSPGQIVILEFLK